MPDFKTQAQKQTYDKIGAWMREIFGEQTLGHPTLPSYAVRYGSCLVQVAVDPWGENDATIIVYSYAVTGAEMREDLLFHLLKKNNQIRFGAFALDDQNNILFQHTIVGSTCDKNELRASIMAVIATADESDDEIIARWGGQRSIDRR